MSIDREIEKAQNQLIQIYELKRTLTDAAVINASITVDKLILRYYSQVQKV